MIPAVTSYGGQKYKNIKNIKLGVVWEVMELNLGVVTGPYSTISLKKCINRGREVHERGLVILHCYARGIGTLIPATFSLYCHPYIVDLGG